LVVKADGEVGEAELKKYAEKTNLLLIQN